VTFELDGEAYVVIQFTHIKPGKGSPFVRLKMKNLITGNVIEQTFRPEEKVKSAYLEHKKMQYLYEADGVYTFMDSQTYEQVALTKADLGDSVNYLIENIVVDVVYFRTSRSASNCPPSSRQPSRTRSPVSRATRRRVLTRRLRSRQATP